MRPPFRASFAAQTVGVVVGLDLIGDALIKLPFLRALRAAWPKADIAWLTSQGPTAFAGPLRDPTKHLVDRVIEQPEWLTTGSVAGAPRFDLLIDTRNRWRRVLATRRVPHRMFLAPAWRFMFSDRRPNLFASRPQHLVDRLLQLVELAGHQPSPAGALPLSEEALARARTILPPGRRYVGFAPGAGNPAKIWPRANFERLAAAQDAAGRTPVFLLGPGELGWQDSLRAVVPGALFPLQAEAAWGTPDVTLEQTLAIGSLLDFAVANDSGTGHMLAAVECPLVSLFGPTSAAKLAPRVSEGLVIDSRRFGSREMRAIPWEAVRDVVEAFARGLRPKSV